jgi:hypothetical protein
MRSLLVLTSLLAMACGSRTIGDGFDIDTNIPEDGAVTTDTATIPGSDAIVPGTDGGTVEPSPTIRCGMSTCVATSQECCVTAAAGGGTAVCQAREAPCRGVALSCTSPAGCGGQTCCLVFMDGGGTATCQPTCMGGRGTQALCETDADCTGGRRCRNAMFGGLRVCL